MPPHAGDFTDQKIFSTSLVAALAARRQEAAAAIAAEPRKAVRPSRDAELHADTIKAAIPAGYGLCTRNWYRLVCQEIRGADLNANRKRSLRYVARAIHLAHTKGAGIFMAGVEALLALSPIHKATVNRALATLREWNLLVTVAEGRTAEFTSYGQNDRAVWALIGPVDKIATPTLENPIEDTPKPRSWAQHFIRKACGSAEYKPLPREDRDVALWHGHATTNSLDDEQRAARELQRRLYLALGKASHEGVRRAISPFLRSGHTVLQLIHMIDHRPDGSPWPHDGATGANTVIAWMRNRLNAWMSK